MIEWLAATVEQRKALYRTVRRIMAEEAISWNSLYNEALRRGVPTGIGFEDNFRAGRISRQAANQIYRWIAHHHPSHSERLEQELGTAAPTGERWRKFLQMRGRFECVQAMLLPTPVAGIVSFAKPEPLAQPVIPLGAAFCFEIDSPLAGWAIALQNVDSRWYCLPLRPDGLRETVTAGRQFLPPREGGEPRALSEETQAGRHGFLFIIGDSASIEGVDALISTDGAIMPETLDRLADALEAEPSSFHPLRINLLFVLPD